MESGAVSRRHPKRLAIWLAFVVGFLLLSYASRAADADTPDDLAYRYSSSVAAAIQFVLVLGILLLIGLRLPKRELFALRRPASWKRALGLVVLALVAIYGSALVYTQILALFGTWDATEEQGLVPDGWDSSRAGAFVTFFLAVTILAPVVEELTYRGIGVALLLPYGAVLAVLLTGVLFGAAHGLLVGLPVLVVFGIVNAWLRLRTDSIYPPILVHSTFNAIAMIASVTVSG
ncbi:MAG TPA: type II CAAX endopeptidase family protein [Gaiellaceae bacterium]|nr:type II CAAX endopeptidase family protein [Gaiellaceae bacterium]